VSEIDLQGVPIVTYNLHLESRSDDDLRLAQLNDVLHDAAIYDLERVVILAGDLKLNASTPRVSEMLARFGFRETVPTTQVATTPRRHLLEAGHHIDWRSCRAPRNQMGARF